MESKSNFKDHFSSHAHLYARYRPDYPKELFSFLSTLVTGNELAWDCATGSGQAALSLTRYFEKIIATDASERQIRNAQLHDKITFAVALAENCELKDHSADLITVAQALHWLDHDKFYREIIRVIKPGGVFAAWAYGLTVIDPGIDELINQFYSEIVGPYWPPERHYIEDHYQSIPFPFKKINAPAFTMNRQWSVEDLLAYLGTWSATRKYMADQKSDPLSIIEKPLKQVYKNKKQVNWPIYLLAARIS